MHTNFDRKFTALILALMINTLLIGGVALLFDGLPGHSRSAMVSI